jgi:hypothetical protein
VNVVNIGDILHIRTDDGLMLFVVREIAPARHEERPTHYPFEYDGPEQVFVSYTATLDLVSCGKPVDESIAADQAAIVGDM